MGKQTNYYLTYSEFLQLAQAALDEGCSILRNGSTPEPALPFRDLSGIDPAHRSWLFVLPEAAEIRFPRDRTGAYAPDISGSLETQVIEAGFSMPSARGVWNSERLYIPTTAYVNGQLVPRSEEATRIYDRLARLARKLAPPFTATLNNGATVKLRVSPAVAAAAGTDGALLGEVWLLNHPRTPQEQVSMLQEMIADIRPPDEGSPFQAIADSLKQAISAALGKED